MTAVNAGRIEPPRAALFDALVSAWSTVTSVDAHGRWATVPPMFFRDVSTADLAERDPDLLAAALAEHWMFTTQRRPGETIVRASLSHLHIVTDDAPFLVDSVSIAVRRAGAEIGLLIHPILHVRRDPEGVLLEARPPSATASDSTDGYVAESHMLIEIEPMASDSSPSTIEAPVIAALANVRAAVTDWQLLRERAAEVARDVEQQPIDSAESIDRQEAGALLRWVADNNFTLVGAADFRYDEHKLRQVPGSGLGVMRDVMQFDYAASDEWRASDVLLITKTETESVVHRPGPYDVIGTKSFGTDGHINGERRIIGFFTSEAYYSNPTTIPVLRRKVEAILTRSGFNPKGHASKELKTVLDGHPRDELFAAAVNQLFETAIGVVQLQGRRRVRLFLRRDVHRRVWTAIVYLPRDRYNTDVRRRIEATLGSALKGGRNQFSVTLTESPLARLYFVIHLDPEMSFVDVDEHALESALALDTRSWGDALRDTFASVENGDILFERFAMAFPPEYTAVVAPATAVVDAQRVANVQATATPKLVLEPASADSDDLRLKIYVLREQLDLADLLPMLANLGFRVSDERATRIDVAPMAVWMHDLGVTVAGGTTPAAGGTIPAGGSMAPAAEGTIPVGGSSDDGARLNDAFAALVDGRTTDDGLNRLIATAQLTWRDVQILRAYTAYLRQIGFGLSQGYIETTLVENPTIAADLVSLFHVTFDPDDGPATGDIAARIRAGILDELNSVASLDQDRIVRALLTLVEATVRTNWYQRDDDGAPRPALGLKILTEKIADAPLPRPKYEIFVHSPIVEGVHLRMGAVARGGIRWSERPEDFRTEVLGLMKAQAVKNAVIVPAGAKGGFVTRRTFADRPSMQAEVIRCYRLFINTLLDLTDNLVDGAIIAPARTVRLDPDDSYLVVAADKGTATFSDTANGIALERGFWLGDAFASGGSAGYDHKVMGITARGAWESVKHHLRRLGRGTDDPITVVGIGDMSGDVFGNGMLLSPHINLVAAFDHRHVFIDPTPDAARTLVERQRLFALPTSSWNDFDLSLVSSGGGVWLRSAKTITLSVEACRALGIAGDASITLNPTTLISHILKAPVDLLWNGGIGTYVKASSETHGDVGDRTNDALRVDADQLRVRIVGEGGNLGLTQRARIEFSRHGGLINTDAIDNSAGVDTSDHEVNIKILLGRARSTGGLTDEDRGGVLAEMTDDVAGLVLADNIDQNQALVNAVTLAPAMLDTHARYLSHLERTARLDRHLESLPDTDALLERKAQGAGLTAPELAVVMAYTKLSLTEQFLAEDINEASMRGVLHGYFPKLLVKRFTAAIDLHPLRREIIATSIVNHLVNRNGVTFVFRLQEETHATVGDVIRAHIAASTLFDADALWNAIRAETIHAPDSTTVDMLLEIDRVVERVSRWILRHRRLPLDVGEVISAYRVGVTRVGELLHGLFSAAERIAVDERAAAWISDGTPPELASRVAALDLFPAALDVTRLTILGQTDANVDATARVYFTLDERLGLGTLRDRIVALPRNDRWDALARSALRDDLAGEHSALTAAVLATATTSEQYDQYEAWSTLHAFAIRQHLTTLHEVEEGGPSTIASLSVVLRGLRSLAGAV